jgi:hypothetical protein
MFTNNHLTPSRLQLLLLRRIESILQQHGKRCAVAPGDVREVSASGDAQSERQSDRKAPVHVPWHVDGGCTLTGRKAPVHLPSQVQLVDEQEPSCLKRVETTPNFFTLY